MSVNSCPEWSVTNSLAEQIYRYEQDIAWSDMELSCKESKQNTENRWSKWKEAWLIESNRSSAIVNKECEGTLPFMKHSSIEHYMSSDFHVNVTNLPSYNSLEIKTFHIGVFSYY